MANIDPVRLLKASPAENLNNLNTIDQAESLSDQSVTSFPDELQAAKQGNKEDNAALDKDRQNSLDAQRDLQNLPVNAAVNPNQPANIADKSKKSTDAQSNELTPGGPTLTQLEVAQTITVEEGIVSQVAAPVVATAVQGAQILIEGQTDAEKQSIETLSAVIDPVAAAALAATQAPVVVAPQAIAAAVPTEGVMNSAESIAAVNAQTAISAAGQTSVVDPIVATTAQNIPQEAINTVANPNQDALVAANAAQVNADALTEPTAGVLNAINTAVSDELVNTQATAGAQIAQTQSTDQNEVANVVTTVAALNTQEETPLVSANTPTTESVQANPAKASEASQLAAASIQDLDVPVQNVDLARPAQTNAAPQAVQSSLAAASQAELASDVTKADATAVADAQELAQLAAQSASTNSLRVEARNQSAANADAAIQGVRSDTRIAGLSNEKSAAVTELAANDVMQPEIKDISQGSNGSMAGGLSDLGSRTITSPFSQELRLAQSSQTLKLEPQQASLATGPLHVEVMRVLKEGGGRVIMEVTPPDQGAIQLDLRLDGNGKAYLIVEGASDSTKARLEQGGSQLKEQLEQMGLSLSLDMRDRSSESDHIPFAMSQNFSGTGNGVDSRVDSQLGELMPVGRSGITPDGRVSIYA